MLRQVGPGIMQLTPTNDLVQNEIDVAKAVRVSEFNVQNQQKIEWPRNLIMAKAYVDQLERSQALPDLKTLEESTRNAAPAFRPVDRRDEMFIARDRPKIFCSFY